MYLIKIDGLIRRHLFIKGHEDEEDTYLEVDNGQCVSVRFANDAIEILQFGGQESPKCSLQAGSACLLEAQEVCATDAPHVPHLRAVQGDQMQLFTQRNHMVLCTSSSRKNRIKDTFTAFIKDTGPSESVKV